MKRSLVLGLVIVLAQTPAVVRGAAAPQESAALLAKAAAYLTAYEKAFSVVVSEEDYSQALLVIAGGRTSRRQRLLKSDVLQTSVGENDWVAFRDVYEVDGKPVRDRDTRLQRLFIEAPSQALVQSRRIVAESARYNIGSLERNINVPTMALTYLRDENQSRSTFTVVGREEVSGVPAAVLEFVEKATPTIVRSATSDLPANGRFWIEPESGRVLKSEVFVTGKISSSRITVTYAPVPTLTVWAPVLMKEEYNGRETIRAEARYSNFRQFKVAVDEKIKH
jgi:hypothetical protein